MKRVVCSIAIIVIALSTVTVSGFGANVAPNSDYLDVVVAYEPDNDSVPKVGATKSSILFLDNGEKYDSLEEFREKVGDEMEEQDPSIIFYVHYLAGSPLYIFSNRTPDNVFSQYIN